MAEGMYSPKKHEVYMHNVKLKRDSEKHSAEGTGFDATEGPDINLQDLSKQRLGDSLTNIQQEDLELNQQNERLKSIHCRSKKPGISEQVDNRAFVDENEIDIIFGSGTSPKKSDAKSRKVNCKVFRKVVYVVFGMLFFLGMGAFTIYAWYQMSKVSDMTTWFKDKQQQFLQKNPGSQGLLQGLLVGNQDNDKAVSSLQKYQFNVGMKSDYRLQECQGAQFKQTFPDVDYAFFGYNILKGFPLSVGHDPGFTYPIFTADYSEERQTSDCRYSVPKGLVVVPDVSCITSFSSTTVQTKYEFTKSLSVSANAGGGGWGVSFSASAGYKQSSSEISTGESVFIISTAKCTYYFSKLVQDNAPEFSKTFLDWVVRLNNTDNKETYFDFFEVFGTHFPIYTTFGSRFTYEHKMSSSSYQTKRESGVNVNVQASYSGLFSVSGGFSMDSSQKQAASDFQKSVETKTITVGAPPPANGDAMTWASSVKESPVPMEYNLVSIENLFSEKYMMNMNINFKKLADGIKKNKYDYCNYLKDLNQLDSCGSLSPGIVLKKSRFLSTIKNYKLKTASAIGECIDMCLQDLHCRAITYCTSCNQNDHVNVDYDYTRDYAPWKTCLMLKNEGNSTGEENQSPEFESVVFTTKLKTDLKLFNTKIDGISRSSETRSVLTEDECKLSCINDAYCVAYTFSTGQVVTPCNIYAEERISGLEKELKTTTYFMSNSPAILETTVLETIDSNKTNITDT